MNPNRAEISKFDTEFFKEYMEEDRLYREDIESKMIDNPFIEERERLAKEVTKCHTTYSVKSCTFCDKVLECELRDSYVEYVHRSLTDGGKLDGRFNFDA